MKSTYLIAALAVILTGTSAYAENTVPLTEPVKCYQIAWQSIEKGGLGLRELMDRDDADHLEVTIQAIRQSLKPTNTHTSSLF